MIYTYSLVAPEEKFYDITGSLRDAIRKSNVQNGIAVVYCPHTTAGITINEQYDPDVATDLIFSLQQAYPDHPDFLHAEGNSAAHMKATAVGSSATVLIRDGAPLFGTWQGIYFCEFDPPRNRTYFVKIL